MIIYVFLIFLIIFFRIIFSKNKKYFLIFCGIALIIILSCRNETMGLNDTKNIYYPAFVAMRKLSVTDIFFNRNYQDIAFFILIKCIGIITKNFQICISILAALYVWLILKSIYKYSEDAFISVIVFVSMYFLYGTYLLRQVIAIGILLLSFQYIVNKNIKKFIISVIIAALFHRTALIFLITYPFCNYVKFGKKNYIFIVIAYIVSISNYTFLIKLVEIFDFTGKAQMAIKYNIYTISSNSYSIFGILIDVSILLFTNYFIKYFKDENEKEYMYKLCNILTLGIIFFCFYNAIAEFFRVSLYFSIFNIIALPNSLKYLDKGKNKQILKMYLICIFILYFIFVNINNVNCNPYIFFWEV